MNPQRTILYVADDLSGSDSIVGKLKTSGFRLVSATRSIGAIARLVSTRRLEAIVIDQRATPKINLGLARLVKSFRAAVPVILLSTQLLDPLPRCIDAGVCLQDELGALVPTIELVLGSSEAA